MDYKKPRIQRLHIFATHTDYASCLVAAEERLDVKYIRTGPYTQPYIIEVDSMLSIPNLGISQSGDSSHEVRWYIYDRSTRPRLDPYKINDGSTLYELTPINQVIFCPSGLYDNRVMIFGDFAYMSDDKAVQDIFKVFSSVVKKTFVNINGNWLGPEALQLFDAGMRFTQSVQSPENYRLQRP